MTHKESQKKYYQKNSEKLIKVSSEWAKNNPEKHIAHVRKWQRKKKDSSLLT